MRCLYQSVARQQGLANPRLGFLCMRIADGIMLSCRDMAILCVCEALQSLSACSACKDMQLDRNGPCLCHLDPPSNTACASLSRSGSQNDSPERKIFQDGKDYVAIMAGRPSWLKVHADEKAQLVLCPTSCGTAERRGSCSRSHTVSKCQTHDQGCSCE